MKAPQRRYELSDDEWKCIASYFPVRKAGIKGRPYNDVRTTVNGIIWIARSGAPWRDLSKRYGKWNTVYRNRAFSKRCSMNSEQRPTCKTSALTAHPARPTSIVLVQKKGA